MEAQTSHSEMPSLHQNSLPRTLTNTRLRFLKPRSGTRKISDGGGLYLMVVPAGGRYWRYNYRFNGQQKTIALGVYPDVPLQKARARHEEARRLLAAGVDPSLERRTLRKHPNLWPTFKNSVAGGAGA
jgi:hypothetical protein